MNFKALYFRLVLVSAYFVGGTASSATGTPLAVSPINAIHFVKTALTLALVLVVFFVLARILRQVKGAHSPASDTLNVVTGLSVGVREKLLIVRAGGTHVLIGVCPAGIVKLCDLPNDFNSENPKIEAVAATSFSSRFQQTLSRYK